MRVGLDGVLVAVPGDVQEPVRLGTRLVQNRWGPVQGGLRLRIILLRVQPSFPCPDSAGLHTK